MHHLVPNVRYIGCLCYWSPQDQTLSWEDRDRLIAMSPVASKAFARLVRQGRSLSEITNAELGREIERATGPVGMSARPLE
jgi:hypothetical protein